MPWGRASYEMFLLEHEHFRGNGELPATKWGIWNMGGASGRMNRPGGPGDGAHVPACPRSGGLKAVTVTRAPPLMRRGSFGGGKGVLPVYSNWDLLESCPSGPSQT